MPPKSKAKKGKKADDEDFWYGFVISITGPSSISHS